MYHKTTLVFCTLRSFAYRAGTLVGVPGAPLPAEPHEAQPSLFWYSSAQISASSPLRPRTSTLRCLVLSSTRHSNSGAIVDLWRPSFATSLHCPPDSFWKESLPELLTSMSKRKGR